MGDDNKFKDVGSFNLEIYLGWLLPNLQEKEHNALPFLKAFISVAIQSGLGIDRVISEIFTHISREIFGDGSNIFFVSEYNKEIVLRNIINFFIDNPYPDLINILDSNLNLLLELFRTHPLLLLVLYENYMRLDYTKTKCLNHINQFKQIVILSEIKNKDDIIKRINRLERELGIKIDKN